MTDDVLLRELLLDAAADEFIPKSSDPETGETSPRFQRQMTAMLNDPNRWSRRKHCPAWKRAVSVAAVLLLICAASFSALMAASPTICAGLINWAAEWTGNGVFYRFSGRGSADPDAPLPRYEITAFPEGYELAVDEREFTGSYDSLYVSTDGSDRYISFGYMRMEQGSGFGYYGDEFIEATDVEVNGMIGKLYQFDGREDDWAIVWIDEQSNLIFNISAPFGGDKLLSMAQSVAPVEQPLNLPRYEITSFPGGYVVDKKSTYVLLREIQTTYGCRPLGLSSGGFAFLYYARLTDTRPLTMNGKSDDDIPFDVTVNGHKGWFYPSHSENGNAALSWTDEETGLWFAVEGSFSMDELMHMAQSIAPCDALDP